MGSTRLIPLIISLFVLASLSVTVASAAPTNAKKGEILEVACDNGEIYSVAANGNGLFTPAHILDHDGGLLIPVSFRFVGTDADGNVVFDETISKRGQMNGLAGDLFTCTFDATDEGITIHATAIVFAAPRS